MTIITINRVFDFARPSRERETFQVLANGKQVAHFASAAEAQAFVSGFRAGELHEAARTNEIAA